MPTKKNGRPTLRSTGIVAGEVAFVPAQAGWLSSRLVVVEGSAPPCRVEYDACKDDDERESFFRALYALVAHRTAMATVDAVRAWFLGTAVTHIAGDATPYTSLTQAPGLRVCVEALGGDLGADPTVISGENAERLVSEVLTPLDALALFSPTSSGTADPHRRRLFFLLDYWQLETVELPDQMPLGAPVLRLACGTVAQSNVNSCSLAERRRLVRLVGAGDRRLYLLPEPADGNTGYCRTPEARLALVEQALDSMTPPDAATVTTLFGALDRLSLGCLKSLLQKIVRTGARLVDVTGALTADGSPLAPLPAELVLAATVARLLPLSMFNPHGGGLETGLAALFKRGAIICVEDAWPGTDAGSAAPVVDWMMACAALAAARRSWTPPTSYLALAIRTLDAARRSRTVCNFSLERGHDLNPLASLPAGSPMMMGASCYLFDHFLGGMAGDHAMMRDAFKQQIPLVTAASAGARVDVMPLHHFVDQHCTTAFPYLLPADGLASALIDGNRASFAALFTRVFGEVTGLNPRRLVSGGGGGGGATTLFDLVPRTDAQAEFFREVQRAQSRMWMSLYVPRTDDSRIKSIVTQNTEIVEPYDRLAHAVGCHSISVDRVTYLWTLGTQDQTEINVARKRDTARVKAVAVVADDTDDAPPPPPSNKKRSSSSSSSSSAAKRSVSEVTQTLDEQEAELENVREAVRRLLSADGVRVNSMNGALIKLGSDNDGVDIITVNGVNWEEARRRTISVPFLAWSDETTPVDSLVTPRDSLDLSCWVRRLSAEIDATPGISAAGRQLAISMMRAPTRTLVFPRPARDGGPSRDAGGISATRIHFEAWVVCKLVSDWSALLLCPREGNDLSQFKTPAAHLDLRLKLAAELSSSAWSTIRPEDTDRAVAVAAEWYRQQLNRHLQAHQLRALRALAYRVVDSNHRAHFLWMDMGAGKTATALVFAALLEQLRLQPSASLRCLFVTTKTALKQVYSEAAVMGLRCGAIENRGDAAAFMRNGGDTNCNVVFITHDVVKNSDAMQAVLPFVARSLVVIDEVHTCTGEGTQRNTAVQLLANLGAQVLFMTATPLRSTREKGALRALMQHVANFPCVTENDFVVACGAMVHPMVYDRIPTQDVLEDATTGDNNAVLMRHVPRHLGGLSEMARMDAAGLKNALEDAYSVTDAAIARLVRQEVTAGSRPLVVCRDYAHCQRFAALLCTRHGFSAKQLWMPDPLKNITSIAAGNSANDRIVVGIISIRRCTGYSATHFNVRLRGVFPSNEADRTQIDGRIARTGQPVAPIRLITVHCGITSLVVNKHLDAASTVRLMDQLNGIHV